MMPEPNSTQLSRFLCPICGARAKAVHVRPDPFTDGVLSANCYCGDQHPWIVRWLGDAA